MTVSDHGRDRTRAIDHLGMAGEWAGCEDRDSPWLRATVSAIAQARRGAARQENESTVVRTAGLIKRWIVISALVDPHEVAWAAGFFDAEGTFQTRRTSVGQLQLRASVPQTGRGQVPPELLRFQAAVAIGTIGGPYKHGQHVWHTESDRGTLRVAALLSAWLGDRKHEQLGAALRRVRAEHTLNSRSRPIGPRSSARRTRREQLARLTDVYQSLRAESRFRSVSLEIAWAAGFFDGDGSASTKRKLSRDGTVFYTVCASAAQSGPSGLPEVLRRFRRVVDLGRIYGPLQWRNTTVPGYEWHIASYKDVLALEALIGPHLSSDRREQVRAALRTFARSRHRRSAPPFGQSGEPSL